MNKPSLTPEQSAALLQALRDIEEMSRSASKGPAHVAKLTLSMMAGVAADAIAKAGEAK